MSESSPRAALDPADFTRTLHSEAPLAELLIFIVAPLALSLSLSVWASRRRRPTWYCVGLTTGFLHGAVLWCLFALSEWHTVRGAGDVALAVTAITVVGAIFAGAHFVLDGLVVLFLRRLRPIGITGTGSTEPNVPL